MSQTRHSVGAQDSHRIDVREFFIDLADHALAADNVDHTSQNDISNRPQHTTNCGYHGLPSRRFVGQLSLPGSRQFVDPRPPSGIIRDPFSANPAGFLHAVQRRIQRALLDAEHIT
jgi:hypothetical protein